MRTFKKFQIFKIWMVIIYSVKIEWIDAFSDFQKNAIFKFSKNRFSKSGCIIYTVKTAWIDAFSENNNFQQIAGKFLKIVIFWKCINPCCFHSVNDDHPDFENLNIFEGDDLFFLKIVGNLRMHQSMLWNHQILKIWKFLKQKFALFLEVVVHIIFEAKVYEHSHRACNTQEG